MSRASCRHVAFNLRKRLPNYRCRQCTLAFRCERSADRLFRSRANQRRIDGRRRLEPLHNAWRRSSFGASRITRATRARHPDLARAEPRADALEHLASPAANSTPKSDEGPNYSPRAPWGVIQHSSSNPADPPGLAPESRIARNKASSVRAKRPRELGRSPSQHTFSANSGPRPLARSVSRGERTQERVAAPSKRAQPPRPGRWTSYGHPHAAVISFASSRFTPSQDRTTSAGPRDFEHRTQQAAVPRARSC